jgi:Protein of unknown function (DUF1254)
LAETGPVVIEMPAGAAAGFADDMWQRPLVDMGQTGPDKGEGGKYIIVGPGQKAEIPQGAYRAESSTMNVFWGFRALDKDPAKAKAMIKALKIYPLSQAENPPSAARIVDIKGKKWSQTPPRGMDYWKSLHAILQREPVQERDRFFMAMLVPLGIEKGKPFQPDARQTKLLAEAALVGEAMAKANDFEKRLPQAHYADGTRWHRSLVLDPSQRVDNFDQLDGRAAWFYEAVTTSSGMATKTPGVGQVYLGHLQGQGWQLAGWRQELPAAGARQCSGGPVLVDDGVRREHPNVGRQQDQACRLVLAHGPEEKCRWDHRPLREPEGAGRLGKQLGAERAGQVLVQLLPPLWADRGPLRRYLGATQFRTAAGRHCGKNEVEAAPRKTA